MSSTAPSLLKLLKAYKPKAGSVTVGVVGYPNVGKSSLINALRRSKVCAVAAQAGHTKDVQYVQLERGMRIIDSPGVVFDDDYENWDGKGQKKGSILLRNVIKLEDVDDPIEVVEEILARTARSTLQKIYNLPEFTSTLEFLTMLALNSGKLLKGGTPDLIAAARQVLTDWNQQKIPYFSLPPEVHPSSIPSVVPTSSTSTAIPVIAPGAENVGQAQILNAFSKPFELEGLFGAADVEAFRDGVGNDALMDGDGDMFWDATEEISDRMEDGTQMETDVPTPRITRKRTRSPSPEPTTSNIDVQQGLDRHQSKRQRRSKDIPSYDALPDEHVLHRMARSNPLNRRVLKKEAKRARKSQRMKIDRTMGSGTLEKDDEGLENTFMA